MSSYDSDEEMPPVLVGSKVPLTLLTGALGSGKSTLVQHILNKEHGRRIAVIMNEFSDTADIEARAISVQSSTGSMTSPLLTLPNGCLCCAARDDGFAAIQELVAQRGAFDYILLETTGLADPGPIAESFWQNEEWDADVRLDGVVCVADAMWAQKQSKEPSELEGDAPEWQKQIACADVIMLNKIGDVDETTESEVMSLIQDVNTSAPIYKTTRSEIDLSLILDIKAYSPNPQEAPVIPRFQLQASSTASTSAATTHGTHEHDHSDPSHVHAHGSSSSIKSVVIPLPALSSDRHAKIISWIQHLLWDPTTLAAEGSEEPLALRLKGILWSSEDPTKGWVLQGVRGVYELEEVEKDAEEEVQGKIVVIGRFVDGLPASVEKTLRSATLEVSIQ